MTVLLRTYRLLRTRDLPSSGRACKFTRRAKSSSPREPQSKPPSALHNAEGPKPTQPENVSRTPVDIPGVLWYQRLGPVTNFFRWFHRTQSKRPYTVQVSTSLTVYLIGDLLAQDIGGERYDPKRTLRMLTIGAIASIPGYKWLCTVCARGLSH